MDVTPHELRTVELREAWRGYRQDDVDDLLDRVAATLERLYERIQQLSDRVQQAEDAAAQGHDVEQMLRRTLMLAQKTADEAVADAHQRARQAVEDAEARARELVADAEDEARRSGGRERSRIERELAELTARRDQLLDDVDALDRFEAEYRDRLRALVEADLERLEVRPAVEPPPRPVLSEGVTGLATPADAPVDLTGAEREMAATPAEPAPPVRRAPSVSTAAGSDPRHLDDDAFFATLREAVRDDTPLGPRDDEPLEAGILTDDEAGSRFGALFRRRG